MTHPNLIRKAPKVLNTANDVLNEFVFFIQHQLPGLVDGNYQLTVSQRVNDKDGKPISDDTLVKTYTFAVLGDRFKLQTPSAVIFSTFPNDQASGKFSTVLPHVVFTKMTLPWSRFPNNTNPVPVLPPGQDTDADVPSWLAVLIFDEDDLAQFPALTLTPETRTVGDLFPTKLYDKSTLGTNYSYFNQATNTDLDVGDTLATPIDTIDIPLALFWQTAPSLADLSLLAHVREVSLENKPTATGAADPGEPIGRFSIVFGNRLPQSQRRTHAYLVSLEKLQDFLPNSDGTPPSGNTFNPGLFLRLAVLRSWTFFSTGESAAFSDQLLALNGRPPDSTTDAADTTLTLPYAGNNVVVKNALQMSYVPLNHNLRTDEQTVSWYRGPLVPYSITKLQLKFPIGSPDQATMFDPTTGMLDASYAAAWTLGRQLALQNTAFSTALYEWKKGLTTDVVNAIENEILAELLQPLLSLDVQPAALSRIKRLTPAQALVHKLIFSLNPRE
jgi:hypothetical protein